MFSSLYDGMNEAYYDIYMLCKLNGQKSQHRGGPCIEFRPFSFTLKNPSSGLFTGAARRMNYRFWAAETLTYIAGWGEHEGAKCAQLLSKLNNNYVNFTRQHLPVGEECAALQLMPMVRYGDAVGQGLVKCYETLSNKPNSRQAYVSYHDRDTEQSHEELPCAASAQFISTVDTCGNTCLNGLFNIRSNDLNWGVPYDVASNCAILWTLAGSLGMRLGRYHHVAGSMHFYEQNEHTRLRPPNVSHPFEETWIVDPPRIPHPTHICDIRQYQTWANAMLLEMHRHFYMQGRPGSKFAVPSRLEDNAWAQQWASVVRWGYPSKTKSQT